MFVVVVCPVVQQYNSTAVQQHSSTFFRKENYLCPDTKIFFKILHNITGCFSLNVITYIYISIKHRVKTDKINQSLH